jgi:3-methyl-2-oxobutanoate hydroxymethyltransferase
MNLKHVMVTGYDATFARLIADASVVDSILVGDSLGMVIAGHESTLEVTMDHMIYHVEAVARGLAKSSSRKLPLVIADMPVGSYQTEVEALRNAQKLIQAGAGMVKLEGPVIEQVVELRSHGIRVCGHIGLTPQSIQDYRVQGKSEGDAQRLKAEAKALDAAGVELLVLEMIPAPLAQEITDATKAVTIGIGAGADCGGQVLVLYDLLGLNRDFNPKFLRKFTQGADWVNEAITTYATEVREQHFPTAKHSFGISSELSH